MSTDVAIITKDQQLQAQSWTQEQIDLIKRQIAKDASDDELKLFLYHCNKTGLDPLSKQIYFQKRGGKPVFITAIDGFRLIAARTGEHAGTEDAVFDNEQSPEKATVTVYRLVAGARCSFTASARWAEYCPPKGQDQMWMKMPCTMLSKCAEALALRKAFPNELGATYVKEELDQAGPPDGQQTEQSRAPAAAALSAPEKRPAATTSADLGNYVIKFSKNFKNKALKEVHPEDLFKFMEWLEGESARDQKPLSPVGQEFVGIAKQYLESIGWKPKEPEQMPEDVSA